MALCAMPTCPWCYPDTKRCSREGRGLAGYHRLYTRLCQIRVKNPVGRCRACRRCARICLATLDGARSVYIPVRRQAPELTFP